MGKGVAFSCHILKPKIDNENGPFALTGDMVQKPPYGIQKCGILHWDIGNKGKSSSAGWNSVMFESATFFCHPEWQILYHATS